MTNSSALLLLTSGDRTIYHHYVAFFKLLDECKGALGILEEYISQICARVFVTPAIMTQHYYFTPIRPNKVISYILSAFPTDVPPNFITSTSE